MRATRVSIGLTMISPISTSHPPSKDTQLTTLRPSRFQHIDEMPLLCPVHLLPELACANLTTFFSSGDNARIVNCTPLSRPPVIPDLSPFSKFHDTIDFRVLQISDKVFAKSTWVLVAGGDMAGTQKIITTQWHNLNFCSLLSRLSLTKHVFIRIRCGDTCE